MDNSNMKLNEDVLRMIEWKIINTERENIKSHKVNDIVNEIVKIIKKEVNCTER